MTLVTWSKRNMSDIKLSMKSEREVMGFWDGLKDQ